MDASHNNKEDLELEYRNFEKNLNESHLIIVDDMDTIGANSFVSEYSNRYKKCLFNEYHAGMAVLCSDEKGIRAVERSTAKVEKNK
ncbi:MAG: hypothetical protein ACTSYH_03505 [Candidatus Heimdallarchaeaceae archaeon]